MAKEPKHNEQWCKYSGLRMTIAQRNLLMKSDYVHAHLSKSQIAAKYDLSESQIALLITGGKWVQAKKNFVEQVQKQSDEKLITAYAGMQVEMTLSFNDAWNKLMSMINMMLEMPRQYLMTDTGDVKVGRLDLISQIIERAQAGQERCVGFIDKHAELNLVIQQKRLDLYAKTLGEDDDDVVDDNFIEALEAACKDVWGDETPISVLGSAEPIKDGLV